MKKILLIILSIILMVSITSCSNPKENGSKVSTGESVKSSHEKEETKKEEPKNINVGDVIKTESIEAKINKIELSYDVLPDDTSGVYSHYAAEKGKVYLHIDMDIKNLQKQELPCDKIMEVKVDYNGGYEYLGFPVVEDPSLGFTYANITSIAPLETKGIRFLADVPQEVEESKNPLSVTFEVDGQKYKNTIR